LSPSESAFPVTPARAVQVLWRHKLVCCVVALVVLLGGAAYIVTRPKVYQSAASVALLPVSSNAAVLPNYPNLIASLIPTYVQLVSSPLLLNQAAAALPFKVSGTQLGNEVFAESLSNAAVINIVGESRDPVQAQQIAEAATTAFLARIRGNGVVTTQIYAQPTVPTQPASPRKKLTLVVVALLAVILGLGAGLAWERVFGSGKGFRLPAGPAKGAGQPADPAVAPPVLGIVRGSAPGRTLGALRDGPGTADQDAWRSVRANFMYALLGRDIRSVTVLSPVAAGSTTVAADLAAAVAELGLAVILVDANLGDPGLHEVMNLDNERGLTSTVLDGADPATLPRPVPGVTGLQVITTGRPLPADGDPGALIREQLPRIADLGDLLIADSPPLSSGPGGDEAGSRAVVGATGGVILVIPADAVTGDQVGRAVRDLSSTGARVLGTVLTGFGLDQDGSGSYRSAGTATA
jgi:Mrp family chromosome partitioning ATPase/capsular polysaccharide biosynthesis protein